MFDTALQGLERYMDLLATRQRLVASNLANIDTPGYRTQDIDFASEMSRLLAGGEGDPAVQEVEGLLTKPDGSNVSLDRENRLLAENAIRFNMATTLMKSNLRVMRTAIKENS